MNPPCLVLLGGLPATGKSTVAAELLALAGGLGYVRIDSIEHALRESGEMGPSGVRTAGYLVGYAVAGDLLRAGVDVLAECVNPIAVTRDAWRGVAATHGARLLEVELSCGDAAAHRARVETRTVDIPGLELPDWDAVRAREYEPWDTADLRIDTGVTSARDAAAAILVALHRDA